MDDTKIQAGIAIVGVSSMRWIEDFVFATHRSVTCNKGCEPKADDLDEARPNGPG
jgi:hypothetical protein